MTRTICWSILPASHSIASGSIRPSSSICFGAWLSTGTDEPPHYRVLRRTRSRRQRHAHRPPVEQPQEPFGLSNQSTALPPAETQSAQCNVPVCEQYYHSFRASDRTYQPYWGPRQYFDDRALGGALRVNRQLPTTWLSFHPDLFKFPMERVNCVSEVRREGIRRYELTGLDQTLRGTIS
jgi:hypothetical protein